MVPSARPAAAMTILSLRPGCSQVCRKIPTRLRRGHASESIPVSCNFPRIAPEPSCALARCQCHRALCCYASRCCGPWKATFDQLVTAPDVSAASQVLSPVPTSPAAGMRAGRRRLLSRAPRRDRIPAGSHQQRTLDFPQGQRGTGLDARPGGRPRSFRRSRRSWPDGGSFVCAVRPPQGWQAAKFCAISREIRRKRACRSSSSL